jgi:Zn finger protein HypA/HybF involved in hydrogenase expression
MSETTLPAKQPFAEWIPPPGFVSVSSKVPGVEVYAPAPPEEKGPEVRTFRCPQCNGIISYSPDDQELVCPYCGYKQQIGARVVGLAADRFEFTLEALDQSEKGWGVERQSIHCEACNAMFSAGGGALSTTCPFCGSNRVVTRSAMHDFIRPGYLIPFTVDEEQCRTALRQWLGRGWMHPPELRRADAVGRFTGMYVPFWIFDAHIQAHWRAEVGYERQRRHYRDGKWETETVIEWRWENGDVHLPIQNMLVYGTDKISTLLLERLYPYDLGKLTVYDAAYLAGWQAQAYDIQLKPAWEVGKRRMREEAKDACYGRIHSSHVRNFSMTADFDQERWRYVLLPVYLVTYTFAEKTYHAMVNGQTAAVAGQKPVSWLRVWLAIALVLAPGTLVGLAGLITLLLGIGTILLPIAFVLFVIGLIVSVYIFIQARAADDI